MQTSHQQWDIEEQIGICNKKKIEIWPTKGLEPKLISNEVMDKDDQSVQKEGSLWSKTYGPIGLVKVGTCLWTKPTNPYWWWNS